MNREKEIITLMETGTLSSIDRALYLIKKTGFEIDFDEYHDIFEWVVEYREFRTWNEIKLVDGIRDRLLQFPSISHLFFDERNITNVPKGISKLSHLTYLNLRRNELTSIPESIGDLVGLDRLHLDGNQLTSLPESIGCLVNLSTLSLEKNVLSYLPESIGGLIKLDALDLSENALKTLPESISNLTNLKELNLKGNQLKTLPDRIGNLVELEKLDLRENSLIALPDSLAELKKITRLNLSSSSFKRIPEVIGRMKQLEYLSIDKSKFINSEAQITWLRKELPNCEIKIWGYGGVNKGMLPFFEKIQLEIKTFFYPISSGKICPNCKSENKMKGLTYIKDKKKLKGVLDVNVRTHEYICLFCGQKSE